MRYRHTDNESDPELKDQSCSFRTPFFFSHFPTFNNFPRNCPKFRVPPISISFFSYISIADRRDLVVLLSIFLRTKRKNFQTVLYNFDGSDCPVPYLRKVLNGLNPARVSL